jgi:glycosyltransferase involved in cell wall biosynthesis
MPNAEELFLSVIIPTRNRSKLLWKTLDGLCKQTVRQTLFEVIVVSDGSTDSTSKTVHQFSTRLPIRYLEQSQSGVSAARNHGLRYANASLVLLLDDDVVPSPQLIEAHIRFHDEKPELEAVLLGYVTWHPDLRVTPFMRWYGEYGALFGYSLLADNDQAPPRFFYSCNISLKRFFLMSNGAFNDTLTVLEDNELGYRLAQQGMQLVFRKAPLGYHYQTFTFKESCQRLQRYCSGLDAFLETDAGKVLAKKRASLPFRATERIVRIGAPLLSPLVPIIDTDTRMPNFIYRLFYWYYGQYLSFWSKADKSLLRGE